MSAGALSIRRATADDAAGVAAVLDGAILDGSPTLLDTPFSVEDQRASIEDLPASLGLTVVGAARRHARTADGDVGGLSIERFLEEG